jgi:hypothetical protein
MSRTGAAGSTHLRNSFLHFRRRRLRVVRHQEQMEDNVGLFLAVTVVARHWMSLLVKAEECEFCRDLPFCAEYPGSRCPAKRPSGTARILRQ